MKLTCPPGCPNYEDTGKHRFYCSICCEPIFVGEKYVENEDGDCVHLDCLYSVDDVLEWVKIEVKTENEYDY